MILPFTLYSIAQHIYVRARLQVLKPGLVKGQWSQEEDDRLVGVVERGFRNWGQVCAKNIVIRPFERHLRTPVGTVGGPM